MAGIVMAGIIMAGIIMAGIVMAGIQRVWNLFSSCHPQNICSGKLPPE